MYFSRISTHTPLAGRDREGQQAVHNSRISTHTPLAGRDEIELSVEQIEQISTHTPLAGRDATGTKAVDIIELFLLTRPLRDVTRLQLN